MRIWNVIHSFATHFTQLLEGNVYALSFQRQKGDGTMF
jgi:hypothetical protein